MSSCLFTQVFFAALLASRVVLPRDNSKYSSIISSATAVDRDGCLWKLQLLRMAIHPWLVITKPIVDGGHGWVVELVSGRNWDGDVNFSRPWTCRVWRGLILFSNPL